MQKIPTMFVRDESVQGHPVMDALKHECAWVGTGEGIATCKLDGTNVKVDGGQLFKRQKPKDRDYDDAAYVPTDRQNPSDRWLFEAFDAAAHEDGIYECIGPKVQRNPEKVASHRLVRVVPYDAGLVIDVPDRTFAGLRAFLAEHAIEGIVFHHPDGRFAKIKRRDFGLPWPR